MTLNALISSLVWAIIAAYAIHTCHQDAPRIMEAIGTTNFYTVIDSAKFDHTKGK